MKKIISLFQRNWEKDSVGERRVVDEITPGAEWVVKGEGYATRKWDGAAVLIKEGRVFMRFDLIPGRKKPEGFIPAQDAPDPVRGRMPGWVSADCPAGKWILEAVANAAKQYTNGVPDGTYEACGPKIGTRHGANPEQLTEHVLIPHGKDVLTDVPRDFKNLMAYLKARSIEGIVWWHEDGRMVKIKKSDFPL